MKNGTPVGLQAKAYMDAGKLVPDEVIIGVISERLAEADCQNGFILDGVPAPFPRPRPWKRWASPLTPWSPWKFPMRRLWSVWAAASGLRLLRRALPCEEPAPQGGGVCDACGGKLEARADDKPEVVRDRLKVYHKETAPLKDFYAARNLLKTVENQPTVAETTTAILKALGL